MRVKIGQNPGRGRDEFANTEAIQVGVPFKDDNDMVVILKIKEASIMFLQKDVTPVDSGS